VPGPTFGPPDVIAQGGGFPSTSVTVLVESAGSVTAPLLVRDPSDSYVQQLGTKTSLDQVAALLGG